MDSNIPLSIPAWWTATVFPRLVFYCNENVRDLLSCPFNAPLLQTIITRVQCTDRSIFERFPLLQYLEVKKLNVHSLASRLIPVLKCYSILQNIGYCRELTEQIGRMMGTEALRLVFTFSVWNTGRMATDLSLLHSFQFIHHNVKRVQIQLHCELSKFTRHVLQVMIAQWFPQLQHLILYSGRTFPFNTNTKDTLVYYCERQRPQSSSLQISWGNEFIPFNKFINQSTL